MSNIKLTKAELFKNFLYLKFDGICGVGAAGNIDADYIINVSKDKVSELKNVQALILDFTDLSYEFGNRFLKLFEPNVYRNNSITPISIVSNEESLQNWKSLYEYANLKFDFYGTEKSIFQTNIASAVKSINKRFNGNS